MNNLQMIFKFMAILIFITGCRLATTKSLDCEILSEMMKNDQLYRDDVRCNPLAYIADSLSGGDKSKHDLFIKEAFEFYRNSKDTSHFTRGFINRTLADSLSKLQKNIDVENVRTVHIFLEKVAFNRIDTLKCFMDAIIILAHTPEELLPKTKFLIEEKKTFFKPNSYHYLKTRLNF